MLRETTGSRHLSSLSQEVGDHPSRVLVRRALLADAARDPVGGRDQL
jgi:hypothetical protein